MFFVGFSIFHIFCQFHSIIWSTHLNSAHFALSNRDIEHSNRFSRTGTAAHRSAKNELLSHFSILIGMLWHINKFWISLSISMNQTSSIYIYHFGRCQKVLCLCTVKDFFVSVILWKYCLDFEIFEVEDANFAHL